MDKSDCCYQAYLAILKEELVPAMGCTEPICLAYAAATAREVLGSMPKRVEIKASGNIIKNVKSVIVPNTKGMKGLKASVAAGIVAGNPEKARWSSRCRRGTGKSPFSVPGSPRR